MCLCTSTIQIVVHEPERGGKFHDFQPRQILCVLFVDCNHGQDRNFFFAKYFHGVYNTYNFLWIDAPTLYLALLDNENTLPP